MTSHLEKMRHYIDVTMLNEDYDLQLEEITTTVDQQFEQTDYEELLEDLKSILFKMRAYQGNDVNDIKNLFEERGVHIAADMLERIINKYLERQSYE